VHASSLLRCQLGSASSLPVNAADFLIAEARTTIAIPLYGLIPEARTK
jgi:hypothetical protein